jgi:hypothetical protein
MKVTSIEFPELTVEDRRIWKEWLEEHVEFLGRNGYLAARRHGPRTQETPLRLPGKRSDDVI